MVPHIAKTGPAAKAASEFAKHVVETTGWKRRSSSAMRAQHIEVVGTP